MTNTKKVVAMLLALLMAFSSMTVLGSAVNFDSDDELIVNTTDGKAAAASIATKFFTADGTEITDMGTVSPGQSVKARVYLGTNYYSADSQIILYYDRDFFEADGYTSTVIGGKTIHAGPATVNESNSATVGNGLRVQLVFDGQMDVDDKGTITALVITETGTSTYLYDSSSYLFEIDLKVKADAGDDDDGIGTVYADAADLATEDNMGGYINIPYGESTDNKYEVVDSYYFDAAPNFTHTSVTVNNTVTFNPNHDNLDDIEVTGIIGDTCNVPSVSRSGYTFKGWTSTESGTIAADATTFTMPVKANEVYTANWGQNVTVTLDPNGGTWADDTTASKTEEVEGGIEWANQPADPTKAGYKFMGWSGEGAVDGALPENYPTATDDVTAYTYTAQWKKLVKITINANGGTWADNTTAAKVYQDTNPDTAVVVGGQTWNTTAVPTYDIPEYTYAASGVSRPGYALMGWQVNGGDIIQSFPATFPEDDTTYTAVWNARDVKVYYFADAQAATAADVNTAKTGSNPARVTVDVVPFGSEYTIRGYSIDDGEVATWVTPDNVSYTPEREITINTSIVSVGADGKPGSLVLVASKAQIVEDGEHTATFYTDGGKWSDNNTTTEKTAAFGEGETITAPEATLTKTGYTFNGWEPALGTMGTADVDFTATWVPNDYVINFYSDGSEIDSLEFTFESDAEEPVEFPADPEKEGYTFGGWFIDTDCTAGNEFESVDDIAKFADQTALEYNVYAKWTVNEYTISFDENGGSEVEDITDDFGATVIAPDDPTKTGYTFDGWYEDDEFDGSEYTFSTMPAEDITLYAKWDIESYTIAFNTGVGGPEVSSITAEYNADIVPPIDPEKEGYTFGGWFTDSDCTEGNEYTVPTTMPDLGEDKAVKTVYAKWTVHTWTATYKVDDEDFENNTQSYEYDEEIVLLSEPTKAGYEFSGWKLANGNDVPDGYTMPDDNITIYGTFKALPQPINYYIDGSETPDATLSTTIDTDKPFNVADPLTKAGYTFSGWTVKDANDVEYKGSTVPAGGLNIYGSFTADGQPINYYVDGLKDTERSTSLATDSDFTPAGEPTKAGYEFSGWTIKDSDNEIYTGDTVPAGGLTITGSFTAVPQPVNYYVDGSETPDATLSTTIETDKPFNVAGPLTKAGYSFSGWTVKDADNEEYKGSTVPAGGLRIYGTFTPLEQTITYYVDDVATALTPDTYVTDAAITALADLPEKAGYSYSAWKLQSGDNVPATMPAGGIKVYTYSTALEQTITYYVDGEETALTPNKFLTDATFTLADLPTKAGYTYSPWAVKDAEGIAYSGTKMPAGGLKVYTTSDPDEQLIKYYVDGIEKALTPDTYVTDAAITDLADLPTKAGYSYSAWKLEDGSDVPATMPAGGIKVYTTSTPDNQTITYYVDDVEQTEGTYAPNSTFVTDAEFTLADKPVKAGYSYSNWKLEDGSNVPATMPAGGIKVYTTSTALDQPINYYVDGSETPDSDLSTSKKTDESFTVADPLIKAGYTFSGWAVKDSEGNAYTGTTVPVGGLNIYGSFTADEQTITYYVDGEVTALTPNKFLTDATFTLASKPEKAGYEFIGWTVKDSEGNTYTGTTMPAGGLKVYGIFSASDAVIKYYEDGALYETVPTQTGETFSLIDLPTKAGYSYSPWEVKDSEGNAYSGTTVPAGGLKIYTESTALDQPINYYVDGSETPDATLSTTIKTDMPFNVAGPLTKAGYEFSGWTVKKANGETYTGSTVPAGGLNIYGSFTALPQPITYYVDGEEVELEPNSCLTDKLFELAAVPDKAGYSKSGWAVKDASGTAYNGTIMPAGGLKVYAEHTAEPQLIKYKIDGVEHTTESADYKPFSMNTDEIVELDDVPTLPGYIYPAWTLEGGDPIPATVPAGGFTAITAKVAQPQTITYVIDSVEQTEGDYAPETCLTDEEFTLLLEPEKAGYSYSDWTVEDANGNAYTGKTMPAGGIKVYTTSTAQPQTITYYVDGVETALTPNSCLTDAEFTLAALPEKAGYTYSEWVVKKANNELYEGKTMPAGGIKVFTTSEADKQTITYYVDDEVVELTPDEYATDATVVLASKPTKAGYSYSDWALKNGDPVPAKMPAGGLKVYTYSTALDQPITYYVDGVKTVLTPDKCKTDATVVLADLPTKAGYSYSAWAFGSGNEVPEDYKMPAGGITVYTESTAVPQTITYYVDEVETVLSPNSFPTDKTYVLANLPEKAGYRYSVWDVTDAEGVEYTGTKMPAGGLKAYTTSTALPQTIIYFIEGVEQTEGTYAPNNSFVTDELFTLEEVPAKPGYTTTGWLVKDANGDPYTGTIMPAGGITVDVEYTAVPQTVFYKIDGVVQEEGKYRPFSTETDETFELEDVPTLPGYIYPAWTLEISGDPIPATMPAGGFTAVTAKVAQPQTITYYIDGEKQIEGDYAPETCLTDEEFTLLLEPEKAGYSYSDWAVKDADDNAYIGKTMPAGGINVYTTSTALPQTITYYVDGVEQTEGDYAPDSTFATDEEFTLADKPIKTGYIYSAWTVKDADDNAYTDKTMPVGGLKAYTTSTPVYITITYKYENGNTWNIQENKAYDSQIVAPNGNPGKTGYVFKGWSRTEGATEPDESLGIVDSVTGITFWPVYEPSADGTITFNGNGGKWGNDSTKTVDSQEYDSTIALPNEDPTWEGHTIIGYAMTSDATSESATFVAYGEKLPHYTTDTQGEWFYIWSVNEHTITYDAGTNGGKIGTETEVTVDAEYGDIIAAYETAPEKYGYNFIGWNTQADGKGTYVAANSSAVETTVDGDITVYAIFEERTVNVVYGLYFADGTAFDADYDTHRIKFGELATDLAYNTDEYSLVDWYTDNTFQTAYDFTKPIDVVGSVNIFGVIAPKSYKVTYTLGAADAQWVDAEEDGEATFAYGTVLTDESHPAATRKGYTQGDWENLPVTMPAENVTVTATWDAIEYTIVYDLTEAGGSETVKVAYDSESFEAPAAERDGYELDDWYLDPECTVALTDWEQIADNAENDTITVYANWVPNDATLTFDPANGDDTYDVDRKYDELILGSDVTAPSKTGYYFLYWADESGKEVKATDTVTGDATYTAAYVGRTVTINYYVDGELYEQVTTNYGSATRVPAYDDGNIKVVTWQTADESLTLTAGGNYTVDVNARTIDVYVGETTDSDSPDTYEVTFTLGAEDAEWADGTTDDITADYHQGEEIEIPADPVRPGYTFAGWDTEPGTLYDGQQIYTAQWQPVDGYTVTFKYRLISNGEVKGEGTIETVAAAKDEYIEIPAVPDIDTYDFTETWVIGTTEYTEEELAQVKVTGDVTVYAIFNQGAFTVSFYSYGTATPTTGTCDKLVEEKTVLAGGQLVTATAPTYDYFTFAGWFDAEDNEWETGDDVTASMSLYAKYDRDTVKLVPVDADSTAMIERDGVVETYNTFSEGAKTPYGVDDIITPNAESYAAPANYESWFVYGIDVHLTVADLANYVKVTGNGSYKVYNAAGTELADTANLGTGAVIKVTDNETDTVVEEFYVVIFGDLDGDADISGLDVGRLKVEVASKSWSEGTAKKEYLVKAADLDLDGDISGLDTGRLKSSVATKIAIDQATGYAS